MDHNSRQSFYAPWERRCNEEDIPRTPSICITYDHSDDDRATHTHRDSNKTLEPDQAEQVTAQTHKSVKFNDENEYGSHDDLTHVKKNGIYHWDELGIQAEPNHIIPMIRQNDRIVQGPLSVFSGLLAPPETRWTRIRAEKALLRKRPRKRYLNRNDPLILDRIASWKIISIFMTLVINNAIFFTVTYYYAEAKAHTAPRSALNRDYGVIGFFTGFTYIYGFITAVFNLWVFSKYYHSNWGFMSARKPCAPWLILIRRLFATCTLPICAFLIVSAVIGPLLFRIHIEKGLWNHGCDGFTYRITLNGNPDDAPENAKNVAQYAINNKTLFEYTMYHPTPDTYSFGLSAINSTDLMGNPSHSGYPSISNITYSLNDNTFTANCTSTSADVSTATPCLSGSFVGNVNSRLMLDMTDMRTNTTLGLHAVDDRWVFPNAAPSALLKNSDGSQAVLTTTKEVNQCESMRTCANNLDGPNAFVPVGLLFIYQIRYALNCRGPFE